MLEASSVGASKIDTAEARQILDGITAAGSDVASASTVALSSTTGDFVDVTGTTAITAITLTAGDRRVVRFRGILTLTHNGTTLILPGASNISTADGDIAVFRGISGGVVCEAYMKASGAPVVLITDGMMAATLDLSGKTLTLSAAQKASDYIEIRDEKAAGTDAGGFTSGSWQTRDLNTEHTDAGGHASVAANQITLAAGTYECDIMAPAGVVNNHQAKLYNVTDAADTLIGTSAYTGSGDTTYTSSRITGRFTIATQKVFEVRHQCQTTKATDGFGNACNFGVAEVYTVARFWKVA